MIDTQPQVLVIGGGSAGIAAAVAASRAGCRVVLLERYSFLGGKATGAEVGTICGLYRYSKSNSSEYVSNGFAKEFGEELRKKCGTNPLNNPHGLHYLPYQPFGFKLLSDDLISSAGVEVCFHATVCGAEGKNGKISQVDAIVFDRKINFKPQAVIDCSGEAIVSALLNLPLLESEEYQAAAQVFTMENVSGTDEAKLGMILMKGIGKGIEEKKISQTYDRLSIVPGSLNNNSVQLKLGIAHPVVNKANRSTALELLARKAIANLSLFLIGNVDAFKEARLGSVAMESGIRIGRRPKGKYVLTEEDVLSCKKFNDGIANAAWPIEEWGQDKRVTMTYFAENDHYRVPAASLCSDVYDNLFFAGRNISATDKAIASARVIGICLQTGYAAGKLASATCLDKDFEVTIKDIQNEL